MWRQLFRRLMSVGVVLGAVTAGNIAPSAHAEANPRRRVNDVTAVVERIGNPTRARYPDERWAYARNVWDMEVFDGRLYLGSGNSNNEGPAPNAGPVDLWSYNAETNQFVNEATLDEEQIDKFVIIEGKLYIPNHDPRGDVQIAGFYHLGQDGWQLTRQFPDAVHVYDLYWYRGRLFAGLGNFSYAGYSVAVSDDFGKTGTLIRVPTTVLNEYSFYVWRVWTFFEVGGQLLISTIPVPELVLNDTPEPPLKTLRLLPAIYRYVERDGNIEFVEVATNFFPVEGVPFEETRVGRAVKFGEATVYIGATTRTDHQWTPFGLYAVRLSADDFEVQPLTPAPLSDGALPYDLLIHEGALYVLTSAFNLDTNSVTITIMATTDLVNWREVLYFEADALGRSFAVYGGHFYIGLGSEAQRLFPATGDVLRVRREYFAP